MSRLQKISQYGQQIWLDNLSRHLLDSGELARWIREDAIAGVTSNPAIFYNAIKHDASYQADLARIKATIAAPEARFEALVLPDIRRACDILRPLYDASNGDKGYVSFEVSPSLAHDAAGTLAAAQRLWHEIDRPNAMIKIPATQAGIEAVASAIAAGINVNVTLIFGPHQLAAVQAAHRRGLEARAAQGEAIARIASVASVFISRIDTLLDPRLPPELQGKIAIASARAAYARWRELPPLPAGARPQKLLWASTSSKNPAYRDVCYVEALIGPDTVNTVPDATLAAFRDHGEAAPTLACCPEESQGLLAALAARGVDMDQVGEELLAAGLAQFEDAFAKLLELMT
ncbi:MAG: transaldolase [Azovibrio sp.]|nr:transaldolase [Azovibrio sp.]